MNKHTWDLGRATSVGRSNPIGGGSSLPSWKELNNHKKMET